MLKVKIIVLSCLIFISVSTITYLKIQLNITRNKLVTLQNQIQQEKLAQQTKLDLYNALIIESNKKYEKKIKNIDNEKVPLKCEKAKQWLIQQAIKIKNENQS